MKSTKIIALFSSATVLAFSLLLLLTAYTGYTPSTIMLVPTVTPMVMTTTTLQTSAQTVLPGTTVVLTAQVSFGRSPVRYGSVTFYDDGTVVAESPLDQNGTAAVPYKPFTKGIHTFIAVYVPSSNVPFISSTSNPVSVAVVTLRK